VYLIFLFFAAFLASNLAADVAIVSNFACGSDGLEMVVEKGEQVSILPQATKAIKREKGLWSRWHKRPLIPLRSLGDKIIFYNLVKKPGKVYSFKGLRKENLALVMWEPDTVLPKMYSPKFLKQFGTIFTWDDDLVDNKRFFKFYYPVMRPMVEELVSFEEKKLCTLIATNLTSPAPHELYSERKRLVDFFETKPSGEFDLYGSRWSDSLTTWRGRAEDKQETLKHYRFSLCIENSKGSKGYITEKIFDCFAAGVVPIYFGAPNIEEHIPSNCFIDMRQFEDYDKLYDFLKNMSKNIYEEYLEQIRAYLASEDAQRFTQPYFSEIFRQFLVKK
jgi:hypothetical protein